MAMAEPVNLIETVESESSMSYIRRVMARVLGHAIAEGLTWEEARALWVAAGFDPDRWDAYRDSIRHTAADKTKT